MVTSTLYKTNINKSKWKAEEDDWEKRIRAQKVINKVLPSHNWSVIFVYTCQLMPHTVYWLKVITRYAGAHVSFDYSLSRWNKSDYQKGWCSLKYYIMWGRWDEILLSDLFHVNGKYSFLNYERFFILCVYF